MESIPGTDEALLVVASKYDHSQATYRFRYDPAAATAVDPKSEGDEKIEGVPPGTVAPKTERTPAWYEEVPPADRQAHQEELVALPANRWIEQKPEITYGDWGECILGERQEEKPDLSFDQGVVENTSPQPPVCKGTQSRSVLTIIKEMNSCTRVVRIKSEEKSTGERGCETQCVGDCYYNVSGLRIFQEGLCETKLGGYPLAFGEWGIWNGTTSQQCKFSVPGIYSDVLRKFQLTPGQSHPACNKY